MKTLVSICMVLFLIGCVQTAANIKPETPKPAETDQLTVNFPKWPGVFAYQATDPDVIILMTVKEPATFPVPARFVFKRKDGTEIQVPLIKPDVKK